ncbi:MAG: hypothetical protein C5B53_13845 [Candidatus Melainabacteria bacterium]|nr:MAG: hypothetical protein C5B53_13845 [Candidatus Melainabacteria bacterium]
MSRRKANINSGILALAISVSLSSGYLPVASAADGDLNFKVYSPDSSSSTEAPKLEGGRIPANNDTSVAEPATATPTSPASTDEASSSNSQPAPQAGLSAETPAAAPADTPKDTAVTTAPASTETTSTTTESTPTQTSDTASTDSILDKTTDTESAQTKNASTDTKPAGESASTESKSEGESASTESKSGSESASSDGEANKTEGNKVLKGYVQVVPSGTKIPIIMDTAVDSDTSQEGDEFSARTAEDLTIDGSTVVPAGSIIRGRIATINAPKHLDRSGSVGLKFDTVTTPDNRQIPLVANLVARGGVVHARRGIKDIAIDSSIATLPTLVGVGIGAVAGNSGNSRIGMGGGALIGAGVGVVVGVAILLAKKGKKVDVRPGDELKIELAEDLHMPTM